MKLKLLAMFAALAVLFIPSARAGLIGLYTFDDSVNPLSDSSGAGNHITGTAGTNPVWGAATGVNSTGAYDYSADRLIVPININPGTLPEMTWGAWVRTNTLTSNLYKAMGHDDGAWDRTIGLDNRNPAIFRYTTFTGTSNGSGPLEGTPGPANTTGWTFIAASYDQVAQTTTMYVDVTAATTADPLVAITELAGFGNGATTFAIGGISPNNAGEAWAGAIDQVFIYNEVLTPAKVTAIRDLGIPELLGIPDTDPNIIVTPLSLFGDLHGLGGAPGPQTQSITISNNGAMHTLDISSITFSGADAARYALVAPAPVIVAPGGSVTVDVKLTPPPAGGSLTAGLNIASNDASDPLMSVNVSAIITTDPNIEVSFGNPFGRMTFSSVPALITRNITVRNTGAVNSLTVNAPALSGANAANYAASAPPAIAPGAQADIVVSLTPGAASSFTASMQFTTNDPDAASFTIPLDAAVVLVAPATLTAFYCFDDPGAPLADASGNGLHLTGTAGTDPEWGAGTGFNSTGAFDFSGDRLIAPIDINPGAMPQMTWGAWVRTDTLATGLYKVMGHDDGAWDRTIGLDNRNPGNFRYTSFTGTANSGPVENTPGPVNTMDWTFLAATYDEAALSTTVYVDLNASTTADPLVTVTELAGFGIGWPTFAIGDIRPDVTSESWDGAIDNVFLYAGILTDEQIRNIRNLGKSAIVSTDIFAVTAWHLNPNGTVTLTWNSSPGAIYAVHYSFDLSGPVASWPDDADDVASQGSTTTYTTVISFAAARRAFFSIRRN